MSALVVRLGAVRNYLEQSRRLGRDEPRQDVINRALADIREGFHPLVPPMSDLQRVQGSGSAPAQGGAA